MAVFQDVGTGKWYTKPPEFGGVAYGTRGEAEAARARENPHYQYLEQTWPGGASAYIQSQRARYEDALTRGDFGLQERLEADARRVGYALPSWHPPWHPFFEPPGTRRPLDPLELRSSFSAHGFPGLPTPAEAGAFYAGVPARLKQTLSELTGIPEGEFGRRFQEHVAALRPVPLPQARPAYTPALSPMAFAMYLYSPGFRRVLEFLLDQMPIWGR